jgi:hypothetical protein
MQKFHVFMTIYDSIIKNWNNLDILKLNAI